MAYAAAMQNEEARCEDLVFQAKQLGHTPKELYACLLFAYARKRGARSLKAERTFRDLVASGAEVTERIRSYLRMATPEAEALMQELGVEENARKAAETVAFRLQPKHSTHPLAGDIASALV